jgi:hypothetical protein
MLTFSLLSLLLGMVLGQRFKVLVLLPTIMLILLTAGVTALVGPDRWSPGPIAVAAVAALQVGYVAGYGIHRLNPARTGTRSLAFGLSRPEQRSAL